MAFEDNTLLFGADPTPRIVAIEMGDVAGITEELRNRVAVYNAEDCASTESLRDWLEARRADSNQSRLWPWSQEAARPAPLLD